MGAVVRMAFATTEMAHDGYGDLLNLWSLALLGVA